MSEGPPIEQRLADFAAHAGELAGDRAGDAEAFCERLFRAFGWDDLRHAGASFAPRNTAAPARLGWRSSFLLELWPRGTRLDRRRHQAFEHWQYHTHHPQFVALCNFDELVLHDFAAQFTEPLDTLAVAALPRDHAALTFLLREPRAPRFRNDRVALTREAADHLATVFNLLVVRGVDRDVAQRFTLRCVAEQLAAGLDLAHADGIGLSAPPGPLELTAEERGYLARAAEADWSRVQLPVFGALFQSGMDRERRHALGAHFTSEADIQRIVLPTLVRPWRERIEAAATREQSLALHAELAQVRVLDPACGSGNFLYVAYRELLRLELELLLQIDAASESGPLIRPRVSVRNFFGLDKDPFAVELARLTLLLGQVTARHDLGVSPDPLAVRRDDLRDNLRVADALFTDWPAADVILGNPPFQAKNKMQREFGPEYLRRLRDAYPDVSGRADYCVYWFRRAHDHLPPDGRAGLVGTNTIRQNESRDSGLGPIARSGTITEAVAAEVWSGDAAVNVSIVNWIKRPDLPGKKFLAWQTGDAAHSPWHTVVVDRIGPSLSPDTDVSAARPLRSNLAAARCYQGQTTGHEGFLLPSAEASALRAHASHDAAVLFPYLGGDDLLGRKDGAPSRCVIDFGERDLSAAEAFAGPFARVADTVLPDRRRAAAEEQRRNADLQRTRPGARINRHHAGFLDRWWRLSWRRGEMLEALAPLHRFIACVRVTRRPIFEFVSAQIRPSDALVVFALDDDYSFGVLQSAAHWQWFTARCSTLKRDFRYTSSTVWDAFPWPQAPSVAQVHQVAAAARDLRALRSAALLEHDCSRRELYRRLDGPLRDAHERLDRAVDAAYGLRGDPLRFLFDLNLELTERERSGEAIVGPGLAALAPDDELRATCTSTDCIAPA
ncbi:DNA methyltransferase [Nannocystis punicea]|uniref:site-specific DNA-methyltransferase (adenine-specific) n=1 Tax=Nannocystis punicea TaxID=2995304 RepID=A0ABY7GZT1_9BACT|nr:DNA methyltransferase [Nannocystis poenicansa]WAS92516.1 N-6 DNA methylase [Nannocystis poenicansa]